MEKFLALTYFGNPILRKVAKKLSAKEILSIEVQDLISKIRQKVEKEDYGVGLAAPQVGVSVSISLIAIKPTPTRPNLERFEQVIVNPRYEGVGLRQQMWEGCISSGRGSNTLYAKVPRYKKINATWLDEKAKEHSEILDGFVAHVFQHETDHLDGVLFVDKVVDTNSYMLASEYKKMIKAKNGRNKTTH